MLAALVACAALAACGEGGERADGAQARQTLASSLPAPAAPADGAALYTSQGCGACHGASAQGGMLGPALAGMAAHWTREDLAAFLADPESAVQRSERLAAQKAAYPMPMPGVPKLGEPERLALADWLLAR